MPNGMSLLSGPSVASTTSASQGNPLDRSILGPGLVQSQQHQQQGPPGPLSQALEFDRHQLMHQLGQQPLLQPPHQSDVKDKEEGEGQPQQLTAIFRPDDAGEWKEKLRLSNEASEQARSGQSGVSISGAASWERQAQEEGEESKEEDAEVEDDESNVIGEGEGAKVWKTKRTLRKSVL